LKWWAQCYSEWWLVTHGISGFVNGDYGSYCSFGFKQEGAMILIGLML